MRKSTLAVIYSLVLLMALGMALLIPSGAITEDARVRYEFSGDEADEGGIARLKPAAVLASAAMSDILPAAMIEPLDLDIKLPGGTPIEENFTENGYRDDSIIVELEKLRMFESDVYVAYVKIATPSQLRTAIAGKRLGSSSTNLTTAIASNYNGIVAISGDAYASPDVSGGYIVRQGQVYRELVSNNLDLLMIDELGDLHIMQRGKEAQRNALDALQSEHTIINGFFFGPALVIDGVKCDMPDKYQFDPNSKNPRAGIAQLDVLTYALVVVNGRSNASEGVTMDEFAQIMHEIGAKQAYNLDGGNSATLAFNGDMYNDKPQAERKIWDIIYFASAVNAE